jgi:hypothetical protein
MTELDLIKSKIREHMNTTADHMASGGCEDFNQYNYCAGMIKALALVEREILDLEERANNAE